MGHCNKDGVLRSGLSLLWRAVRVLAGDQQSVWSGSSQEVRTAPTSTFPAGAVLSRRFSCGGVPAQSSLRRSVSVAAEDILAEHEESPATQANRAPPPPLWYHALISASQKSQDETRRNARDGDAGLRGGTPHASKPCG